MKKLLFALLVLGQMGYAQKNKTVADSTKTNQLEEVIVTANKREENIIKVNTAVTSLSSKKIEV